MNTFSALDPRRALSKPWAYLGLNHILGGQAGGRRWVSERLRLEPGQRILDIGCGPGELCEALPPEVAYVGVDISADYLARAREKYPNARFEQLDLEQSYSTFPDRDFDLIVVSGVLHHISDSAASSVFAFSNERLRNGGRLVTLDPVFRPGQNPLARFLISMDRGHFVRQAAGYEGLARASFQDVQVIHYDDLLRVPYSHISMECRK